MMKQLKKLYALLTIVPALLLIQYSLKGSVK